MAAARSDSSRMTEAMRNAALLVAVVLALGACSDGTEAAIVPSSTSLPTTLAATDPPETSEVATSTTRGATTTTPAPSTTTPSPTTAPIGGCDSAGSITGDFDGDGMSDRAAFDGARLELVACHGGGESRVAGSGQGEVLLAADLNGDDVDEILTGGTTAWGAGADVAAVVDGVLDFVTLPTGERLTLWEGLPPGGFLAYGCGDFTGEGEREVAVIEGSLTSPTEATWSRAIYRVDGHDAILVGSDSGSFDPSGAGDALSAPELLSIRGDRC